MERLIWSSQTEKLRRKQNFLKDGPKFPNGKVRSMRSLLLVPGLSVVFVPVEMSVEMEHTNRPMEISIRGFDVSHLLQCSENSDRVEYRHMCGLGCFYLATFRYEIPEIFRVKRKGFFHGGEKLAISLVDPKNLAR